MKSYDKKEIQEMVRDNAFKCIDHILTDHESSAERRIAQLDGVMAMVILINGGMEVDEDDG